MLLMEEILTQFDLLTKLENSSIGRKLTANSTAKAKAEGKAEGLAEGRAEGLAEGTAKGKAEGERQERKQTVLKLSARGFSPEEIAGMLDYELTEIRAFLTEKP
jgi:flagellar biosynthesis/type III secretory pathway protein FliH